jgi:hypothetical protein
MAPESTEAPTPEVMGPAVSTLPPGIVPLFKQPQIEEYFGVSNWTVNEWIKAGLPVVWLKAGKRRLRRFNLDAVQAWHDEQLLATA